MKILCSSLWLLLVGCGTLHTRETLLPNEQIDTAELHNLDESPVEVASSASEVIDQDVAPPDKILPEERESLQRVSKSIHSIPVEMNLEVKKWLNYFTKKDRDRFQRFLSRGAKYRDIVENVLEENGLPGELYYLAMIESGYQNHATSTASAVGVWQFIRGTGKRYGLMINKYIDERRDPIRATEAAVRYLKDLYNVFGSWHLAMAGYNAGENRVVRSIFKAKSRSFWKLVQMKALPPETRNYVPKFLAAVEIGSNPEKYGFKIPDSDNYPDLRAVHMPGPLMLKTIASKAGVPLEELAKVNPHLLSGYIPPSHEGYPIWVPIPLKAHVEKSKIVLAQKARRNYSRRTIATSSGRVHRVKRGENLSIIAKRYSMSVARLQRINGLASSRIYPGMNLNITSKAYHSGHSKYYRVRSGDNLSTIARQFGLSVSQIKHLNGLRSNTIYVGSRLKVAANSMTYYRVKRGDNLNKIASQFSMSVYELKKLNGLRSSRIYAGTRIKVRKSADTLGIVTQYKVRPGDNLTTIAKRFDSSIVDLKNLNNLAGSTIFPGQVLQVKR